MKISPLFLPFSHSELLDSTAQQKSVNPLADFQISLVKLIQRARDDLAPSDGQLAMRSVSSNSDNLSASLIESNLNPYLSMPPSPAFRGQIVQYGAFTLLWERVNINSLLSVLPK
ncbi:Oidioi.mRNA.OKI2018_I69.XSR.g13973.t1.cds [Oikopleura dioica]|uniref:Oidioi.mRNA.OKI2018_I69.XSR.g13973.t1.cds n=1 Tax=Oikopleura dioica TaxID=34765 RepID=A0ABN7S905_OIKDI|nr:Oidioi.mRNA.OKI2018_I69.XSR.g13973.t1.cds [Oikopleura dioica]